MASKPCKDPHKISSTNIIDFPPKSQQQNNVCHIVYLSGALHIDQSHLESLLIKSLFNLLKLCVQLKIYSFVSLTTFLILLGIC